MSNNEIPTDVKPKEGQCAFFLMKKRRFCRFRPNEGQTYCAEHSGLLGVDTSRKRIKCPLNPKHTCYEDKLQKHLKKCRKQQKDFPVYHIPGINSGFDTLKSDEEAECKVDWADIPLLELQTLIAKINKCFEEHMLPIPEEFLSHDCLQEEMSNQSYGIPALRHRKQQASLIGHMEKTGFLSDHTCFVELGAGKGMLSHWLKKAVEEQADTSFVLVDRGHVRYKADNQHKWDDSGPKFERYRIDIEDLHLGKIPSIETADRSVVAMGKHLCGAATDLALRCVTQTLHRSKEPAEGQPDCKRQKTGEDNKQQSKFSGLTIALCCHHRCSWQSYVGKTFMEKCSFSAHDFTLICKLSGWTAATWKGWKTIAEMEADLKNDVSEKGREIILDKKLETDLGTTKQNTNNQGDSEYNSPKLLTNKEKNIDTRNSQENFAVNETQSIITETRGGEVTPASDPVTKVDSMPVTKIDSDSDLKLNNTTEGSLEELYEDHQPKSSVNRADLKLEPLEREEIGRRCKRLIDFGRVDYVRDQGMDCYLVSYIDSRLTPENVAIIAKPKPL